MTDLVSELRAIRLNGMPLIACEEAADEIERLREVLHYIGTAGDRAGQLGEINCADALALYRLMASVEFIHENA